MRTSLIRSIPFWMLLALSLAAAAIGGWLIAGQLGTMTTTLLDGTATGVEVYVGQSLAGTGSVLLGSGIVGLLLALALASARVLLPAPAPVVVEPIDGTAVAENPSDGDAVDAAGSTQNTTEQNTLGHDTTEQDADDTADTHSAETEGAEDQNGSSGSIATATKISVR